METERTSKGMYLVDLADIVAASDTTEELLDETRGLWRGLHDEMRATETLWVFVPNEHRKEGFLPAAMVVGDDARRESDLILKNVITVHREAESDRDLRGVYEEILLLVRDASEYQFHKNAIRVDHVYQGNEWGGEREKSQSSYHDTPVRRYNPDGKDPGNVWLTEHRDETAGETVDETEPISRTEAAKRCVRAGSMEGETMYAFSVSDDVARTIEVEDRVSKRREITSLVGASTDG
jgi:hypothetical protein